MKYKLSHTTSQACETIMLQLSYLCSGSFFERPVECHPFALWVLSGQAHAYVEQVLNVITFLQYNRFVLFLDHKFDSSVTGHPATQGKI